MSYYNWFLDKIEFAQKLHDGQCGGTYADGVLILCNLISTVSSQLWKNRYNDTKKYIEVVRQYSEEKLKAHNISIPLLYQEMIDKNNRQVVNQLESIYPKLKRWDGEVLTGEDIDLSEKQLISQVTLSVKEIREFSYAALLYTEVRCAYAHEYKIEDRKASPDNITNNDSYIVYENLFKDEYRYIHLIYFSFKWIKEILLSIISSVKSNLNSFQPISPPIKWWIDG